eukprot:8900435-Pyramimonas_sp.AAC.1
MVKASSSSSVRKNASCRHELPGRAAPQWRALSADQVCTDGSRINDQSRPSIDTRPIARSPAVYLGVSSPITANVWVGQAIVVSTASKTKSSSAWPSTGSLW